MKKIFVLTGEPSGDELASEVISKVKITYLRLPTVVQSVTAPTVDCDLPVHTHQEIVDMTINSLLEAISDPRYQTQSVEVLKSE